MDTISSVLTADHRQCDDLFAAASHAAGEEDWVRCRTQFDSFVSALKRHMQLEEEVLFPAFEQASGMAGGPTWVMRQEHQQMLSLLDELGGTIEQRNASGFRALAQTFTALMDGHSMKEERVLYPMCDRVLPDFDTGELSARLSGG